jgi:predicted dehydrogenase
MVGYAIIGCGRVAPNHVDGARATGEAEVRWACDADESAAKVFAGQFTIPRWTTDLDEVLRDPAVAAVSVAVDHRQHAGVTRAALRAGKHVLVEKPLALSIPDAEALVSLAVSAGRTLAVVSQHRYDPVVVAVRRWLRDGLLGTLLYGQVSLEANRELDYYTGSYWRGTWSGEGGSALINQGYHCLDVTRHLLGPMTVRAAVATRSVLGEVIETEDTLSALMTAEGVPVTVNVTVGSALVWRTRIELVGNRGAVTFDLDHPGTLHRAEGDPELERRAARDLHRPGAAEPVPGVDYYGISHRQQIAAFIYATRTGAPIDTDGRDAVAMVSLLADIYEAAGNGRARSLAEGAEDAPSSG